MSWEVARIKMDYMWIRDRKFSKIFTLTYKLFIDFLKVKS